MGLCLSSCRIASARVGAVFSLHRPLPCAPRSAASWHWPRGLRPPLHPHRHHRHRRHPRHRHRRGSRARTETAGGGECPFTDSGGSEFRVDEAGPGQKRIAFPLPRQGRGDASGAGRGGGRGARPGTVRPPVRFVGSEPRSPMSENLASISLARAGFGRGFTGFVAVAVAVAVAVVPVPPVVPVSSVRIGRAEGGGRRQCRRSLPSGPSSIASSPHLPLHPPSLARGRAAPPARRPPVFAEAV